MTILEKEINKISRLSPDVMKVYLDAWECWTLPKDYVLLREYQLCDYIFFMEKGIARIYYYKNEREITEWLAMDERFFLSIISFFQRKPSRLIIKVLESSEVWGIHYNILMELAHRYHEVETMLRKMMTGALMLSQYRMDGIQFETAEQRYSKLLASSPEIIKRVPLSYIASFLGITMETLSRIRSKK